MQAYLYAFPWAYMPNARWLRTEALDRQADRFDHIRHLEDAKHLSGGAPNNDTLYSRAWVYLKDEPVILTVPAIADRYYTMEIVDFMGDNFAYVGTRATGTKAGNYAIVGPDWKGTLPEGVTALPPSSTPWATILGRTYVKDASDLDAAHAIQDQYKLTPAVAMGQGERRPAEGRRHLAGLRPEGRPARRLEDDQPGDDRSPAAGARGRHVAAVCAPRHRAGARCRGAGRQHETRPRPRRRRREENHRRRLHRRVCAEAGQRLELSAALDGTDRRPTRDWLFRAVQMLAGFVANDPVEATYLNVSVDGDGKPLTGKNRYVIHFDKGGEPKVKAFWSVTMYNPAVQSRRQSDRPLFARRPLGHEARRRRRPHDLRAEGLAGRREGKQLAARARRAVLPDPAHLPAGGRHRRPDLAAAEDHESRRVSAEVAIKREAP